MVLQALRFEPPLEHTSSANIVERFTKYPRIAKHHVEMNSQWACALTGHFHMSASGAVES